jgi:tetratricopeptide (TPR) repeat protein
MGGKISRRPTTTCMKAHCFEQSKVSTNRKERKKIRAASASVRKAIVAELRNNKKQHNSKHFHTAASTTIMGLETQWICSDERHYGAFECSICQTLPEPADCLVTTTPCSHVFCRSCLSQWITNHSTTCPTCNHDLLYSSSVNKNKAGRGSMQIGDSAVMVLPLQLVQPLAYRLLSNVLVKCPLSKHVGCTWRGDYADLQSHLVSSTAHNATSSTTTAAATSTTKTTSTSTSMEGDPMDVDHDTVSEENTITLDQQWQMCLKTAAAIKEEANSKFETRRYDDAHSLYTKAIAILEECIDQNAQKKTSNLLEGSNETSPEEDGSLTPLKQQSYKLLSALYSNRAAARLSLGNNQDCINDCRYAMKLPLPLDQQQQIGKIYVRACRAAVQLGDLTQANAFVQDGLDASVVLGEPGSTGRNVLKKEADKVRAMQEVVSKANYAIEHHWYAEAKSCYSQLLLNAPSALPFLLGAARSDLGLGLTDSALRLTKRILLKHPKSSMACWVRGQTLFLMGESAMGLKLIQEGLRLDPDAVEIRTSYRSFKKVKEWMDQAKQLMFLRQFKDVIDLLTKSIEECESASSLPPKSPLFATLHTDRAEAYLRLKEYNHSLKDCAKVVYAQEGYIPAWLICIQAHHGLDDHETAMEEIKQLLQRFEQDERLLKAYEKADFLIRKKNRVDYYDLFGVSSIASAMEIKKAYKKRSLDYHPDRIPPTATEDDKKEAHRKFQLLGEGLEILCDDFQRKLYDEGYDPAAIRERVETANRAAHNHRNGRYPHHHGGGRHGHYH